MTDEAWGAALSTPYFLIVWNLLALFVGWNFARWSVVRKLPDFLQAGLWPFLFICQTIIFWFFVGVTITFYMRPSRSLAVAADMPIEFLEYATNVGAEFGFATFFGGCAWLVWQVIAAIRKALLNNR